MACPQAACACLLMAERGRSWRFYNAAGPVKQADPLRGLSGFASLGGAAYLGGIEAEWSELMSAVERLEDRQNAIPDQPDPALAALVGEAAMPSKRPLR